MARSSPIVRRRGDLGVAKPDPEGYRTVVGHFGVTPTDAVFVDDSPDYVEGACTNGLQTHLFTGHEELVAVLITEGVELGR